MLFTTAWRFVAVPWYRFSLDSHFLWTISRDFFVCRNPPSLQGRLVEYVVSSNMSVTTVWYSVRRRSRRAFYTHFEIFRCFDGGVIYFFNSDFTVCVIAVSKSHEFCWKFSSTFLIFFRQRRLRLHIDASVCRKSPSLQGRLVEYVVSLNMTVTTAC